jgi:HAD superfamily hydrolase (TIGR01549 family)
MFAVLFDLEGTLVESPTKDSVIISEYRSQLFPKFKQLGIPQDILDASAPTAIVYNNSLEFAIRNFSTDKLEIFQRSINAFMIEKEVVWADQSKPCSDAVTLLEKLKALGVTIGLVTNTCKQATEIMLNNGSLINFFDTIITRTDVKKIKSDPESTSLALSRMSSKEFYFVGDSEIDAIAATALGGISIIIKSNHLKRTFYSNYFISSLSEVYPLIQAAERLQP